MLVWANTSSAAIRSVWSNGPTRRLASCLPQISLSPSILPLALRAMARRVRLAAASTEGVRCLSDFQSAQAELAANCSLRRRCLTLVPLVTPLANAARSVSPSVLAVRVWPAADYTRVTLERSACREVLAFHGEESGAPGGRSGRVSNSQRADSPRRQGRGRPLHPCAPDAGKPGVVRLVMELKTEVRPQVFFTPVGNTAIAWCIDVYPGRPGRSAVALLEKRSLQQGLKARRQAVAARACSNRPWSSRPGEPAGGGSPGDDRARSGAWGEDPAQSAAAAAMKERDAGRTSASRRRSTPAEHAGGADARFRFLRAAAHARAEGAARAVRSFRLDPCRRLHQARCAWRFRVFVLPERASSSAARWLANKENAADLIGGVNSAPRDPMLARTLLDLSQTATINDSLKLGKAVLGELGSCRRPAQSRMSSRPASPF